MKLGNWIKSVASGRISHWNDNNNQLVSDLWVYVERLHNPLHTAFKDAIVSSLQIMERMLGPDVNVNGWIKSDFKSFNKDDFLNAYRVLVGLFIAIDVRVYPALSSNAEETYKIMFHKDLDALITTKLINADPPDIKGAANLAWKDLSSIFNPKAADSTGRFSFVTFVLASANENTKNLKEI